MRTGGWSVFRGALVSLVVAILACNWAALDVSVGAAAGTPAGSTLKDPYNGGTKLPGGGGEPGKAYMAFVDAAYRKDYRRLCACVADSADVAECLRHKDALDAYIALLTQPKHHEVLGGFVKGDDATLDVAYTFEPAARSTGFVVMKRNKQRWAISSFGGSASTSVDAQASGQVELGSSAAAGENGKPQGGAGRTAALAGSGPAFGKWTFDGKDDKGVHWTGTITLAKLDTTSDDAGRYYALCSLDRTSGDSPSGVGAPCVWDPAHRTLTVSSSGSFEYTAVLQAGGKALAQGKWKELSEDFDTKKVIVTKSGIWSATYTGP